jgi:hypothetical protein
MSAACYVFFLAPLLQRVPSPIQHLSADLRAQGRQDDGPFYFIGRTGGYMRSGVRLAALAAPFLLMQDFAGVPLDLPKFLVVGVKYLAVRFLIQYSYPSAHF